MIVSAEGESAGGLSAGCIEDEVIACARTVSARTVAVATGRYSVDELAEHGPTATFVDLTDTATVVAALVG